MILTKYLYCNHFLADDLNKEYLSQLPIYSIDFSNDSDVKSYNQVVSWVDIMLDLNKKIQTSKGNEKDQIQRQIYQTDKEIDELVYKLYGLTKDEIAIVEGLK